MLVVLVREKEREEAVKVVFDDDIGVD